MAVISLSGASIRHKEERLTDVTCQLEHARIALVGPWQPLLAYLSGQASLSSGRVTVSRDGAQMDARRAVQQGRIGVAWEGLPAPASATGIEWLTDSFRLLGMSQANSKAQAKNAFRRLKMDGLAQRRMDTLGPAEHYAARLVFALSTEPVLIFAEAPAFTPEQQSIAMFALDQVSAHPDLFLCCDPIKHTDLMFWCGQAALLIPTPSSFSVTHIQPSDWFAQSRGFSLRAVSNQGSLEHALLEGGVRIHNRGEPELLLTLPEEASSDLIVEAAVKTNASLTQLVPLLKGLALESTDRASGHGKPSTS